MKKFLATLLVVGSLFFVSTADAELKTYVGEGNATMNETENQEQLINRAKGYAIRNAQEQVAVYITSQAKLHDLTLSKNDVANIAGGLMKITNTQAYKSLRHDFIQVRVKITAQLDTDALQIELDKRLTKPAHVEKPKPIESPKPAPIDKPKPIEQPQPVSQDRIKTYVGTDDYTVGQRETPEQAQENSKLRAFRNAQEQAGFYLRSQSRSKDLELVDDEIITVAASIMKIIGKPEYKTEVLNDGRSILLHTKVTVQIDIADLERRLEELARRKKH